jgi:hypothetical protein
MNFFKGIFYQPDEDFRAEAIIMSRLAAGLGKIEANFEYIHIHLTEMEKRIMTAYDDLAQIVTDLAVTVAATTAATAKSHDALTAALADSNAPAVAAEVVKLKDLNTALATAVASTVAAAPAPVVAAVVAAAPALAADPALADPAPAPVADASAPAPAANTP